MEYKIPDGTKELIELNCYVCQMLCEAYPILGYKSKIELTTDLLHFAASGPHGLDELLIGMEENVLKRESILKDWLYNERKRNA